jgi:hypothetical protein
VQAVSIAYQHQRRLPANIAAAVLISAPHTKNEGSVEWTQTLTLMKKTTRTSKTPTVSPEVARDLVEDCRNFELAFQGIPVATLFEQVETRTGLVSKSLVSSIIWGIGQLQNTDAEYR